MNKNKIIIVAEAGVNHNGDLQKAIDLINVASECGADYVKFQTFKANKIASETAPLASYQKKNTHEKNQKTMLKRLELKFEWHQKLIEHARKKSIKFMSTSFDLESTKFLSKLGMQIFKIPSGEITNLPYLRLIGGLNKKVILSTGMAKMNEIGEALKILIESGTDKRKITLLHCTTEYPTPFKEVNLNVINTLKKSFNVRVGYSDHTKGISVSIAAAALGATIIEKHFTLDRNLPGPDHKASLEPNELMKMVESIREIEFALGSKVKYPTPSERKNIVIARKSIIAKTNIKKGDKLTKRNLDIKRPGSGISPMRIDEVLGKRAIRKFTKDELIEI